jgi:imidazolonepropionase-like amidohydrolase
MKHFFITLLILIHLTIQSQQPQDLTGKDLIITNVNVITMTSEQVLKNQTVVVKNGKVTEVKTSATKSFPKNAMVIDGTGKYLMPGLAEMHAHVPPIDDIAPMKEVLLLFAVNGVTSIRGMLGHPLHLQLREGINNKSIPGPHLYTSGPSFNGNTVKTEEQAAARVNEQKAAGYDFLKLHPGLTVPNFNALVKAAKAAGIPFAGHVSFDVGIWRAIDAGYATVDHMDGFVESLVPGIESMNENETGLFSTFIGHVADTALIPKLVQQLAAKKIWVVPTQALAERWLSPLTDPLEMAEAPEMKYMPKKTVDDWIVIKQNLMKNPAYDNANVEKFIRLRRKLIYDCNKGGVGLLLGSDGPQVFNVPGFSVHHELKYLVDAGLTPYEAIKTGTVNVGAFYKQPLNGTIQPGAPADLLLLSADPLQDINNTKRIESVLIGTSFYSGDFIKATLKSLNKN